MNNFNFLPDKFKKRLKNEISIHLLYAGSVAVLIWGVVFGIIIFTTLQYLNIRNNALEDNIVKVSALKETAEARNLEKRINEINELSLRIKDINQKNSYDTVELIASVARAVPPGVVLKDLNFYSNTKRIFVSGKTSERTQISILENNFEEEELFIEVDGPLSNLIKTDGIYNFSFTITLRDEE